VTEAAGDWRRLDTRMLLVHPLIEFGRAIPALLALVFAGSGNGHGSLWGLIGAAVVVVLAILRWVTTRYRITAEQVQLRHGVFRRRTVAAPLDRVRTVDVTAHALHRLLGLTKVVIGTGTSDRKGRHPLTLDGLRADQAARLRAALLHRAPAPAGGPPVEAPEQVILALDPGWIRYAPFTLSGAITALAVGGFAWRIQNETQANPDQIGPLHAALRHLHRVSLVGAIGEIGVALLVFIALASVVGYVLAFWRFQLTRHQGGSLHITRGLITRRATSIEERRLRGAELSEPLLLRLVDGARTIAIATGLRVGRGAERGGGLLAPPCPRPEAVRVAATVLSTSAPFTTPLRAHGHRARRRRYTRAVGVAALAALAGAGLWWWIGGVGWLASAVLLPVAVALAADRAANLGHALVDGYVVTRYGSLVRRRCALSTAGVIGWNLHSSYFQRRAGLVTLTATTAAGRQAYRIVDVPLAEALALANAATPGLLDPVALRPAAHRPLTSRR
jgi:putative membrane protein